jgi:hypothetical protein
MHTSTFYQNDFVMRNTVKFELEKTIDLVLIDQQSVGEISLHLMGTVNVKKRWMTI